MDIHKEIVLWHRFYCCKQNRYVF